MTMQGEAGVTEWERWGRQSRHHPADPQSTRLWLQFWLSVRVRTCVSMSRRDVAELRIGVGACESKRACVWTTRSTQSDKLTGAYYSWRAKKIQKEKEMQAKDGCMHYGKVS